MALKVTLFDHHFASLPYIYFFMGYIIVLLFLVSFVIIIIIMIIIITIMLMMITVLTFDYVSGLARLKKRVGKPYILYKPSQFPYFILARWLLSLWVMSGLFACLLVRDLYRSSCRHNFRLFPLHSASPFPYLFSLPTIRLYIYIYLFFFLKIWLAKIRTHSTTWQLKTIKLRPKPIESPYLRPFIKKRVPRSIRTRRSLKWRKF